MALDIITTSQGGTCAITKTECCVYTPDESGKMTSILGIDAKIDKIPEGSHSMQYLKQTNIKKIIYCLCTIQSHSCPIFGILLL